MNTYHYVFFGTPDIAATTLDLLIQSGMPPSLVVTAPAKAQGRGLVYVDSPVAQLAQRHNIPYITPEKITPDITKNIQDSATSKGWDFFLVIAYAKLLPEHLLQSVHGKVINIHPSLLPLYRGPSPIESVLLSDDTETGVTLMEIDTMIDHGPIIAQTSFPLPEKETIHSLSEKSAHEGVRLLQTHLSAYCAGTLIPSPQQHSEASHTRKYTKQDGVIHDHFSDTTKWKIFRTFIDRGWVSFHTTYRSLPLRVKITNAHMEQSIFVIDSVIPENKKEMSYAHFLLWLHQ